MTRVQAGATMTLTFEEWVQLNERMHGESTGGWILTSKWRGIGTCAEDRGCVAITLERGDYSTLTIFLSHLIQVTVRPFADDWEDLRYLADQVQVFRYDESVHPTYYLPCVTVAPTWQAATRDERGTE